MHILVIEGAAPRRVAIAQYLLRAAHRVTISSSIEEAREILQFITKKSEAPDAVVIGDRLASRDDTSFREEIADCLGEAIWVPLPSDLSLQWLADWLQGAASRKAVRGKRSLARGSSVLVVETNRAAREAAHARFASEGATVRTLRVVQGRARDDGEMERPQDAAGLHRVAHPGTRWRWHQLLP
jgi:3',5'-cyclic AMP phosphodiesterase CpdA